MDIEIAIRPGGEEDRKVGISLIWDDKSFASAHKAMLDGDSTVMDEVKKKIIDMVDSFIDFFNQSVEIVNDNEIKFKEIR